MEIKETGKNRIGVEKAKKSKYNNGQRLTRPIPTTTIERQVQARKAKALNKHRRHTAKFKTNQIPLWKLLQ